MSCDVGRRLSLDPELLRLWYRLAATAPIGPLAWEPSYSADAPLKRQKEKCTNSNLSTRHLDGENHGKYLHLKDKWGVPVMVQWLTNPTRNHEVAGSVPALAQWVNDPVLP